MIPNLKMNSLGPAYWSYLLPALVFGYATTVRLYHKKQISDFCIQYKGANYWRLVALHDNKISYELHEMKSATIHEADQIMVGLAEAGSLVQLFPWQKN